jgi:hypothetical protein
MSQRERLLELLIAAGPRGVDNHDLVYREGITRAADLVFHLKLDGHRIETVDQGTLPDGRRRLCRYILHPRPRQVAPEPAAVAVKSPAVAAPILPMTFLCGCTRAADGKTWTKRCAFHLKHGVTP